MFHGAQKKMLIKNPDVLANIDISKMPLRPSALRPSALRPSAPVPSAQWTSSAPITRLESY